MKGLAGKIKSFWRSLPLQNACELFLVLICIEVLFQCMSFQTLQASIGYIAVSSMSICMVLSAFASFLPLKGKKFILGFSSWVIGLYAIIQLGMKNMMGNYTSVHASTGMLGRVFDFVPQFIAILKPQYYLVFLPSVVYTVYLLKTKENQESTIQNRIILVCIAVLMHLFSGYFVSRNGLRSLYDNPKYIEKGLREFGLSRFLLRDFLSINTEEDLTIEMPVSKPEPTEETIVQPEETVVHEEEIEEEIHREMDDTDWIAAMEAEENEKIKIVDQFLMQREYSDYNEMTGILEGQNLIYIMIEAFDYMALDEQLTPTLWMMKEEGWDFTHHYTPKYSCTTGESEFISEVSLIPESDVCTPNQYARNQFPNAIFQIFENQGYYSSAYHNWKDEFYDRRVWYANSGCEVYLNYDDQKYTLFKGWPSDKEMIELTINEFIDKDKFMTLYVTSSTHFPYDQDSELGNRYLPQINEIHPDYPMNVKRYISKSIELDKAMEYLLQQLEEHGKLENTTIVFFADHHPLKTDLNTIADYTFELDKREGLNEDRTPFVIYSKSLGQKKLDEINSTFDILPTVFNLFNMNYDPRIYLGTDYFGEKEKLIYFPNGDWISEEGIYYMSSSYFAPFDETSEIDSSYVETKTTEVQNLFNISSLIFRNDYFKYRDFVTDPKMKK